MNPMPASCPVCDSELVVTRLHCLTCDTTLEGEFQPGASRIPEMFTPEQLKSLMPFSRLSPEQLYFILTFVRCEGRFNRMEEELNLSYPTLRNRLDDILRQMGFEPIAEPQEVPASPTGLSPDERQEILEALSRGEITSEEARQRLSGQSTS